MPALAVSDLVLRTDTMEARVAYATVRPALLPLLRGNFEPGNVHLLRPQWQWYLPASSSPQAELPESKTLLLHQLLTLLDKPALSALPPLLQGCDIQILHGTMDVQQEAGPHLMTDSVNASIRIRSSGIVDADIDLGGSAVFHPVESATQEPKQPAALLASVDALHFTVRGLFRPTSDTATTEQNTATHMELTTRLHVPHWLQGTNIHLSLEMAEQMGLPLRAMWNMDGTLLWKDKPLPFQTSGEAQGMPQNMTLRQVRLALAEDSLLVDGNLELTGKDAPRLKGHVVMPRFSLTQWFGFARLLPPGLQHSLHRLQGSLNFELDAQGLEASQISVQAADGHFSGTGGVASFASPVITLELDATQVTLDKAFPEATGLSPAPPHFAHPPLTPEPGTPAASAMPGPTLGYDINLRVSTLKAWGLDLGEVGFRCLPGSATDKGKTTQERGVLMHFGAGRIYGGRGEGRLFLRSLPDGQTAYNIKAALHNINAEKPATSLMGKPWLGGRLSLDTEFTARGKTVAAFLASQEGSTQIVLENGYVLTGADGRDKGDKIPFAKVHLQGRGKAASTQGTEEGKGKSLSYSGNWKAQVDASDYKADFQMEGPLFFVGKNFSEVRMHKAPGHLSLHLGKALTNMAEDCKVDINGRFSLHTGQRSVGVEDAEARVPSLSGLTLKGQVHAAPQDQANPSPLKNARSQKDKSMAWQAKIAAKTNDLKHLLRLALPHMAKSMPPDLLQALAHKAEAEAQIRCQNNSLALTQVHFAQENMHWSGKISGQWIARPQWTFALTANTVDLDRFFPPRSASATKANPPSKSNKAWDLGWMHDIDIQGLLQVQSLRVRKLSLHKARFPLQLQKGILQCSAAGGQLYGSAAQINLKAEALPGKTGLKIQAALDSKNMNFLSMSEDRGMRTALAGRGSVWCRVQGTAYSAADIPAALDGGWRLQVNEGFMQDRNDQGVLIGSRTYISHMQASGSMEKGILRSTDLTIQGPNLTVNGGGWVNLVDDSLDVDLVVDMRNLPTIPVRFHGPMKKPQRSIKTGAVLAGTLGSLGAGVMDVLGGFLGGVLQLF